MGPSIDRSLGRFVTRGPVLAKDDGWWSNRGGRYGGELLFRTVLQFAAVPPLHLQFGLQLGMFRNIGRRLWGCDFRY